MGSGDRAGADGAADAEADAEALSGAMLLLDASDTMARAMRRRREGGASASARVKTTRGRETMGRRDGAPSERALRVLRGLKNADHRRLIYRWTNALIRAVGLKVPMGAGGLISQELKNKREKFDKFLLHYYGEETFGPGSFWFSNSNVLAFFSEIFYVATEGRVRCAESDIAEIFYKTDPNRKASTWVTSTEALERFGISRAEVYAIYCGNARVENGWAKGQPLCVPTPLIQSAVPANDVKLSEAPTVVSRLATGSLKRPRSPRDISVVGIEERLTPLGWKHSTSLSAYKGLSLLEQKAVKLCHPLEPCDDTSPLGVMVFIADEILERGRRYAGPRTRPCERNQVNKFFGNFMGLEVFSTEDVGTAIRVKDSAVLLRDPFLRFTKAHAKLKEMKALVKKIRLKRDVAACTLAGLMNSKLMQDHKGELNLTSEHQQTCVNELEATLTENMAMLDAASKEFEASESGVKDGYLQVVRSAYEFASEIQDKIRAHLCVTLEQVSAATAAAQIEGEIKAREQDDIESLESKDKAHSLVERRAMLLDMMAQLEECSSCVSFSLSTLEQRWNRFKIFA